PVIESALVEQPLLALDERATALAGRGVVDLSILAGKAREALDEVAVEIVVDAPRRAGGRRRSPGFGAARGPSGSQQGVGGGRAHGSRLTAMFGRACMSRFHSLV